MHTRGHETIAGVLSPTECDGILEALAQPTINRGPAGARHLMSVPAVATVARREDLLSLARRFLGGRAVPFRATLFEKSGEKNWLAYWHQDTALPLEARTTSPEWGPWSEKAGILYAHAPAWALQRIVALRLHLDASTPENGPLRIVPGTHRLGVLPDEEVSRIARERAPTTCLAGRGAVLAMRPLLIHASSKAAGPAPRRVLHIEYADAMDLAPGIRLAIG